MVKKLKTMQCMPASSLAIPLLAADLFTLYHAIIVIENFSCSSND